MAIVISGNGIDMGNNPVSNASQIDGVVINEAGAGVATLIEANSYDLGVGQTVYNVTASRSADVTYTNTTGKPIFITITGNGNGGTLNRYGILTVDGVTVSTMGTTSSTQNFSCSFVVPNDSTYKYTHSNMSIQFWHELR